MSGVDAAQNQRIRRERSRSPVSRSVRSNSIVSSASSASSASSVSSASSASSASSRPSKSRTSSSSSTSDKKSLEHGQLETSADVNKTCEKSQLSSQDRNIYFPNKQEQPNEPKNFQSKLTLENGLFRYSGRPILINCPNCDWSIYFDQISNFDLSSIDRTLQIRRGRTYARRGRQYGKRDF